MPAFQHQQSPSLSAVKKNSERRNNKKTIWNCVILVTAVEFMPALKYRWWIIQDTEAKCGRWPAGKTPELRKCSSSLLSTIRNHLYLYFRTLKEEFYQNGCQVDSFIYFAVPLRWWDHRKMASFFYCIEYWRSALKIVWRGSFGAN